MDETIPGEPLGRGDPPGDVPSRGIEGPREKPGPVGFAPPKPTPPDFKKLDSNASVRTATPQRP